MLYNRKEKLEDLNLSIRPYNCLRRAGAKSLGDICKISFDELLGVRNLGRKSMMQVVGKPEQYGFGLKGYSKVDTPVEKLDDLRRK